MDGRDFEIRPRKKKNKFVHFKDLILFEDERVLVVNKPAGLSSLAERDETELNLLDLGRKYDQNLQLCHRLDKPTTGVIVFSKSPDVYREMAGLFAKREVLKHYIAIVHGARDLDEFEIDAPILVGQRGKSKISFGGGKEAITVVDTAEKFKDYTLVDCHPITGRLHQIRVHLASIGAPLIGDDQYGGKDVFLSEFKRNYKPKFTRDENPINDGFQLHARGISFVIPGDEEETTFLAPPPKKMEVVLKILRKYNS